MRFGVIKKVEVSNFKSFDNVEINLDRFNVLIGANASGKSNFIDIFRFLRDIINYDLENAISMQGGIEYLRNVNIGSSKELSIKIVFEPKEHYMFLDKRVYETIYEFSIKFNKIRGFKIKNDKLTHKCADIKNEEEMDITFYLEKGKLKVDVYPDSANIKKDDILDAIYPTFLGEYKWDSNTLLLETPVFIMIAPELEEWLSNISIYYIDPKLPKKATPITGKAYLEEDGSNLSIILKNIIENPKRKRQLFNLVNELLPFIEDLGVEKFADKSLLLKLREMYSKNHYLPASLVSDGTINIIALIIAMYFEEKPVTIIEEPERNIHPYLISKVVDMMKDVSRRKQIIITTHNPEIIKYAGLDSIILVSRNKDGFSTVCKPARRDDVITFLKNEIFIDELYVQNLLGV
ncbi:MAG: AAA family ATPase [Euryarchaeota archaeon]|nr:AAA family ATPase [Euryarchaeota archaeon]